MGATGSGASLPLIDRTRLRRGCRMLSPDPVDGQDAFHSAFGSLQAELSLRSRTIRTWHEPRSQPHQDIAASANYVAHRFRSISARLYAINWLRRTLATASGDAAAPWFTLAGLAIRDFHGDVSSCMDAVAVVLLASCDRLTDEDREWLPAYSTVQTEGRNRSRLHLHANDIVDGTERWWPAVKAVRDTLVHREQNAIVYGGPRDGVFFQVYDASRRPLIADPAFMLPSSTDVVDFHSYGGFILAEVLLLLDDPCPIVSEKAKVASDELPPAMYLGQYREYWKHLDAISRSCCP